MKYSIILLMSLSLALAASKKAETPEPQDSIAVVGHVALTAGSVGHMTTAVHWQRNYLYIEQLRQGTVTIIDVTTPAAPKVIGEFAPPADDKPLHIAEVEGTAALLTTSAPAPASPAPDSVVIMSFADPARPRVERRFGHVTGLLRSESRGLTYLVNDEGLWILQHQPAPDRELERQYQHEITYNH
jgi:hypothetical protein